MLLQETAHSPSNVVSGGEYLSLHTTLQAKSPTYRCWTPDRCGVNYTRPDACSGLPQSSTLTPDTPLPDRF